MYTKKRKKDVVKHYIKYGFLFIILLLCNQSSVLAQGIQNDSTIGKVEIDYNEIQNAINDVLQSEDKFDFKDYVMSLVTGEKKFSLEQIGQDLKDTVYNEIHDNLETFTGLISIAVIAAVFTNFSYAFQSTQVAETGFYVAYLLLFSVLTASFIAAANLASDTISAILEFMKALVPAYFLSVAFVSSAGTSTVFYQVALFLITFVDVILIRIIIPLINIFLVISMANNLSKDDMLSKLTELISTVIGWSLKTMLGLVIGFNAIQGLILPVADNIKRSALTKIAGAIPGVGGVFGSVAESVIGAGVLLKNAIGVVGVIVIITICAIPIIKLAVTTLIYRVSGAAVQPISDKRMLKCITASADASLLLLQTVLTSAVLFLLTITIVAATTS
ncbi:MAG: stage III sporulation protein AE [Anaerocolumna sp.]